MSNTKEENINNEKAIDIVKVLFNAIFTTAMIVALLLVAIVWILPLVLGLKPVTVLSGSMEPTFSAGDVIWVNPQQESLSMGEIVVFKPEAYNNTLVTHRIVSVNTGTKKTYTTQGDANNTKDDPIVEGQIVGTVKPPLSYIGLDSNMIAFPKVGYLQQHLFTIGLIIVGIALIMYLFSVITEKLSKRGEKSNEEII